MNSVKIAKTRSDRPMAVAALVLGALAFWSWSATLQTRRDGRTLMTESAISSGIDGQMFRSLMSFSDKLAAGGDLTELEWATVKQYLADPLTDTRTRAAPFLLAAKGKFYETEAIQIARTLLNDPDPYIVVTCMTALKRLGASGWERDVKRMTTSAHEAVRKQAALLLMKDPPINRRPISMEPRAR